MDFIDFTLTPKEWSVLKNGKSNISPIIKRIMRKQEAMENFVFPDKIKTKLEINEFMNIFLILTGILQKSCKRSFFIYTKKQA